MKTPNNTEFTYKFEITVKTKENLSVDQILIIHEDFWKRLEGYHTESPDELKNADIEISYKK